MTVNCSLLFQALWLHSNRILCAQVESWWRHQSRAVNKWTTHMCVCVCVCVRARVGADVAEEDNSTLFGFSQSHRSYFSICLSVCLSVYLSVCVSMCL